MPISELVEYEHNAKKHTKKQIKQIIKSIDEFGFNDPIAIDENNMIIEGHGRMLACIDAGITEVPVIRLEHLSEEQKRAYILAHNKLTLNTEFDIDLLNDELKLIDDIDMTDFGFITLEDDVIVEEDDFTDMDMNDHKVEPGAIYQLGRHRVMCGDSTDPEQVSALMNGVLADLVVTDPPYNVNYEGKTAKALKIQNDSMDGDVFRDFLKDAFYCADTVLKPGGAFYIWFASSESYNFYGACKDVEWEVKEELIWAKNSMVLGRQDYHWQHEPCLYGWKNGASHYWGSDRKQTTLLEFDRPQCNKEHPTMKPIALFDYQIKNSSRKGENVLDLFGGSGTTVMACEQNNRNAYVMELDAEYVEVILNRWEEFTGKTAKKITRE